MTGKHASLVTTFGAAAKNNILRIRCLVHQIELVAKPVAEHVDDGA